MLYTMENDGWVWICYGIRTGQLPADWKKGYKRKGMLADISNNLKGLYKGITLDVSQLKSNLVVSMNDVNKYSVTELKKFLNKTQEANITLSNVTNNSAETIKSMWTPGILYTISIIELICYVIFFVYKRKVTDNFKKYD